MVSHFLQAAVTLLMFTFFGVSHPEFLDTPDQRKFKDDCGRF